MHSTPILLVLSCGVSSGSLLLSITTFFLSDYQICHAQTTQIVSFASTVKDMHILCR